MPADPAPVAPPSPHVQVRLWLPRTVVEFLDEQAGLRFESRNALLRHLIVSYFNHAQSGGK